MTYLSDLEFDSNADFKGILGVARQGEQKTLGVLLDFYRSFLLATASRKLSQDLIAKVAPSDLVQETLMKASSSFADFHGSTEPELRAWLGKILERKVIDTHRYYRDYARRDVSREVPLIEQSIQKTESADINASLSSLNDSTRKGSVLVEMLSCLNDDQRKAIQLRTFERLSFEDVGRQLGRSTDAARKIWTRAIQKIAQEFQIDGSKTGSSGTRAT